MIKVANAFHLKVIMCVIMALDHMWWFIPGMPLAFHQAGRSVMPVFAFLLAQGMVHTRNRQRYISLILWFAVATYAGNMLIAMWVGRAPPFNILFSFAVAAQMIVSIDSYIANKNPLWLVVTPLLALVALMFDGAWLVTAPVLIFYYLRDRPVVMLAAYAVSVPAVMIILDILFGFTFGDGQWMMVFAVIPLMFYNGERGVSIKYFFYVFYPLHMWIIYLIGMSRTGRFFWFQ
ncbi:MAG: conjugal transfer protein TraX [Oscillospiraceae bacterium]|nr:conjugal transfer protein TraX [Oscillospiraceae bacterium]